MDINQRRFSDTFEDQGSLPVIDLTSTDRYGLIAF